MGKLLAALVLAFLLVACGARETRVQPNFAAATEVSAMAIVAVGNSAILGGWTGSGWYIASDGNNSVVATAGHVCNSPNDPIGGFAKLVIAVYATEESEAYQIYDHDRDPDDVCLLYAPIAAPDVIAIGSPPYQGDQVSYVGYPNGMLGAFDGTIVGQEDDGGYIIASIPAYYGSSGSAVVNESGDAVGLISRGDMTFTNRAWLVPTDKLIEARDYARGFLYRLRTDAFATSKGVLSGDVHRDQGEVETK